MTAQDHPSPPVSTPIPSWMPTPSTSPAAQLPLEILHHIVEHLPRADVRSIMAAASSCTQLGAAARGVEAARIRAYAHVKLRARPPARTHTINSVISRSDNEDDAAGRMWYYTLFKKLAQAMPCPGWEPLARSSGGVADADGDAAEYMRDYTRILTAPEHSGGDCTDWWPDVEARTWAPLTRGPRQDRAAMFPLRLDAVRLRLAVITPPGGDGSSTADTDSLADLPGARMWSLHRRAETCCLLPERVLARVGVLRGMDLSGGLYPLHRGINNRSVVWGRDTKEVVMVFEPTAHPPAPARQHEVAHWLLLQSVDSLIDRTLTSHITFVFLSPPGTRWVEDPVVAEAVQKKMDALLYDIRVLAGRTSGPTLTITVVNPAAVYDHAHPMRHVRVALQRRAWRYENPAIHGPDDSSEDDDPSYQIENDGNTLTCMDMREYLSRPGWELALDEDEVRPWRDTTV